MSTPGTPIVVLGGPTASGKTRLALDLAERLGAEIVGADSVQIVREFDLGSSKPTAEERDRVPHHAIDALGPLDPIDAGTFAAIADRAIDAITARGRRAIVVGGTGLWIRALVRGLMDLPPVDPALRARLESEVHEAGPARAHARLAACDPLAAARIHPNDALRIVRALEVFTQTGRPAGELRRAHAEGRDRRSTRYLALDPPLDVLTPRIGARVDAMMAAGFEGEVRSLMGRYGRAPRALGSVGYRQLAAFVESGGDRAACIDAIKLATRTYARRQRNWFHAERGVTCIAAVADELAPGTTSFERLADELARHFAG